MKSLFLLFALAATSAWAQQQGLSGPTPGYVFDGQARELRPIRGVVGAAHLGSALVQDADAASASADGTLAIASRFGSIELIRGFDSAAPTRLTLAQEPGDVLFAWSGHDVAAVFPATRKVQIWRNVDTVSDQATALELPLVEGAIRSILLDGDRLVLATQGGLYLAAGESTRQLLALTDPSAVVRSGNHLFIADRAAGHIILLREYAGSAIAERFAGVASPVGIQLTNGTLLVASADSRTVDAFDLTSKLRTASLELDFPPTRMESLGVNPLALLNTGSATEPLYILDSRNALQVYFVPAGREQ